MTSIPEANVYAFVQRQAEATPLNIAALRHVAIVPAFQVVDANSSNGAFLETARVDFDLDGSNSAPTTYHSAYRQSESYLAPLPGLITGAAVDADSVDVWFVQGRGAAEQSRRLFAERRETQLLASTGTWEVTGGQELVLTVPTTNIGQLLEAAGVDGWDPTTEGLNPSNNYAVILLESFPDYPLLITGWSSTTVTALCDLRLPEGSDAGAFQIILRPAQYRVVTSAEKAFVPVAYGTETSADLTDAGGTHAIVNLDPTQDWVVTIVNTGVSETLGATLDLTASPRKLTIQLETDGGGSLVNATNTVEAVNEAIQDAFDAAAIPGSGIYRPSITSAYPLVITGSGYLVKPITDEVLAAHADDGLGRLEYTTAGIAGNDYHITLQVAAGSDLPMAVSKAGTAIVITLGTDGDSLPDPALNTATLINAALSTANIPVRFVDSDGDLATTEVIGQYALGTHGNHLGFTFTSVSTGQSKFLWNGMEAGSLEIYGGLMAYYGEGDSPGARVYASYRALRRDLSSAATLSLTGTDARLTELLPDTYKTILGSTITTQNPASVFAEQFFLAGQRTPLYLLSPDEVSADYPWGTPDAMDRALAFAKRRPGYHLYIANDSAETATQAYNFAVSLGGTETEALVKAALVYIPSKNPTTAPDLLLGGGDEIVVSDDVLTAALDFTTLGVLAGDVIVVSGREAVTDTGTVDLGDGTRGYVIESLSAGGSPMAVTLTAAPETDIDGREFSIYRPGDPLYVNGVFQASDAVAALEAVTATTGHIRLQKHHVDTYETPVANRYVRLDGVYALANLASLIASNSAHKPISQLSYPLMRRVYGTSSLYSDAQLSSLTGAGLILPVNRDGDDSTNATAYVRRDVTSNPLTSDTRRRSAIVAEDMLNIKVGEIIKPRLGYNLVTESQLNLITMDLNAMISTFQVGEGVFRVLKLNAVRSLTAADAAAAGIDDTGVYVSFRVIHHKELSAAVSVLSVEQDLDFIVTPGN